MLYLFLFFVICAIIDIYLIKYSSVPYPADKQFLHDDFEYK